MHIRSISLSDEAAEAALELFQYGNDGSREVANLIDALTESLERPERGIRISVNEFELEAALDLFEEYEDDLDQDSLDALDSFESATSRLGCILSDRQSA